MIRKNSHLRIARYHQHLHELLDLDISPLDYMLKSFPEVKEREEMRKIIGRYGLTGRQQVSRQIISNSPSLNHQNSCRIFSEFSKNFHKFSSKCLSNFTRKFLMKFFQIYVEILPEVFRISSNFPNLFKKIFNLSSFSSFMNPLTLPK